MIPSDQTAPARKPLTVTFPGGKRVVALHKGFEIATDQPIEAGGHGSAPAPFDLFVASLATCAGYYVLEFCDKRGIPADGIHIEQTLERDPETRAVTTIHQEITVPADFPDKYRKAVLRAAESCTVKKLVQQAPRFEVRLAGPG